MILSMPAASNIAWGRLLAESAAIVVSILLAFAIDAWWADRQERAEEARLLMALKVEFEENARQLPRKIADHRRSADAAAALIDAFRPAIETAPVSVRQGDILFASDIGSFDPARGTFDAMMQSGGLRYIRNPEIRRALAEWPSKLNDALENEQLLRTIHAPQLVNELAALTDMGLMQDMEVCYTTPEAATCRESTIEIQPTLTLIGSLAPVRGYAAEAVRELELVRQIAVDIAARIGEELE